MKTIGLMSLNFVALTLNLFSAQADAKSETKHSSAKPEVTKSASLKSFESSWLKVPPACKAAGFNAKPVALINEQMSPHATAVYQSFGA